MNKVFIFGAGASKDAGGPLIRDFMSQGMFYLCNQDTYSEITAPSFRKVFELVDLLYGTSFIAELDKASKQRLCNIESMDKLENVSIEDILSFIDLGMSQEGDSERHKLDYHDYKKALDDFIFETIQLETTHGDSRSKNPDGTTDHKRNLYDMLVDYGLNISDRNSFITFNYDLLLDKAVSINDRGLLGDYAVPFVSVSHFDQYRRRILSNKRLPIDADILKLHGSLNWAVCTKCNAPHLAFYYRYTRLPREHCSLCQALLAPVLVSPIYRKDIGKYSFLAYVWRKAQEIVGQADEITVIGYSFPEADMEAKWLFKRALLGRVNRPILFLVEPASAVRERIRSFFLDTVETCIEYENFMEYCKKIGCYRENR